MAAALEEHDALVARIAEAPRRAAAQDEGRGRLDAHRLPAAPRTRWPRRPSSRRSSPTTDWPRRPRRRGSASARLHGRGARARRRLLRPGAEPRGEAARRWRTAARRCVSQATAEIVRDRLPPGTGLVELGRRELRGLARPEHVFELRRRAGAGGADARRKTVTVLFACVMDLEPEGEGLDAEARRRVSVALPGGRCAASLERHGGTVEAYPGDALMAVYGVPLPARGRRRAGGARRRGAGRGSRRLGEEFGRALGLRPRARIGVGTGEVIAAGGRPGAAGDAVNVAKRLEEQAARRRDPARRANPPARARRSPTTEPLAEPESARPAARAAAGRRAAARAARLAARGPRPASSRRSRRAFDGGRRGRACHLVTVLGAAGVGKSRLVEELTSGLGDAATRA